jgi:spermidine/putrescine transport system substrate-binding protein
MDDISRRRFLRGASALAAAAPAAGLLGAVAPAAADEALESEVNVISWAQEWEPVMDAFKTATGVTVNNTFQTDPTQTTAMIKASPGTFDVVSYGPFDSPQIAAGLMAPLDLDRVKQAWDGLHPYFREIWDPKVLAPASLDGKVYHLTFYWGSAVLAWNTDVVKGKLDSWQALADPKYKGKTSILDQSTEMYGAISLMMGKDLNHVDDAQLKETRDFALELIHNQRTFWSTGDDLKQLLSAGDVAVAYCWDGIARALVQEGKPVDFSYPKEGVRGWIDGPGIIADAPNPNAAAAFINYVCGEPRAGIEMAQNFYYAPANQGAMSGLNESTKALLRPDALDALLGEGRLRLNKFEATDFQKLGNWWSDIHSAI